MKFSKVGVDAAPTGKAKKPIFKRWWFWAIIVIVVLGAFGSGGKSDTPASSSSAGSSSASSAASSSAVSAAASASAPVATEESKAAAKSVDAEIFAICTSAENDYKVFTDMISSGTASDLDLYNAAKTLKSNLQYYNYTQLSAIKGDGIDEYKQSISLYLYTMSDVANKAMDYIDDPITSKLSTYQDAVSSVQTYLYDAVTKRLTFLTDAGLSSDEISAITSSSTTDTAN